MIDEKMDWSEHVSYIQTKIRPFLIDPFLVDDRIINNQTFSTLLIYPLPFDILSSTLKKISHSTTQSDSKMMTIFKLDKGLKRSTLSLSLYSDVHGHFTRTHTSFYLPKTKTT
jgi:hypothetical protein